MPMKPPVNCTVNGCKSLARAGDGGYCREHKRELYREYAEVRTDRDITKQYNNKAWKTTRDAVRYRDKGMCVLCGGIGVDVDHIIEVKDGGDFYDMDNLQLLCRRCHGRKTADEVKARNLVG